METSWSDKTGFTDCPGAQLIKIKRNKQKQQCRGKRNI
jgi:hypothetical protein